MIGSFVATPAAQALQTNYRVWENFSNSSSGESELFLQSQQEQWENVLYNYEFSLGPKKFHTLDTYEGRTNEPQTLHKYLYAHSNPVTFIDPSGNLVASDTTAATVGQVQLGGFTLSVGLSTSLGVGKSVLFKASLGSAAYFASTATLNVSTSQNLQKAGLNTVNRTSVDVYVEALRRREIVATNSNEHTILFFC